MRIALTTMVMIPSGAVAISRQSAQPIEVDRNCFVTSSPNKMRSGERSLKRDVAKLEVSTVGVALAELVVLVELIVVGRALCKVAGRAMTTAEQNLSYLTIENYCPTVGDHGSSDQIQVDTT